MQINIKKYKNILQKAKALCYINIVQSVQKGRGTKMPEPIEITKMKQNAEKEIKEILGNSKGELIYKWFKENK